MNTDRDKLAAFTVQRALAICKRSQPYLYYRQTSTYLIVERDINIISLGVYCLHYRGRDGNFTKYLYVRIIPPISLQGSTGGTRARPYFGWEVTYRLNKIKY